MPIICLQHPVSGKLADGIAKVVNTNDSILKFLIKILDLIFNLSI